MADDRKITIEILSSNGDSGSGGSSQEEKKPKDVDPLKQQRKANREYGEQLNKTLHPIKAYGKNIETKADELFASQGSTITAQAIVYLATQAAQVLERAVDYGITRHLNLTEDYLSQNTYNAVKAQYNLVKSGASSVLSGAMNGAMAGGPAGAVVGAVVGGLSWGANEAITQSERYSQYYQQLNATNFNTQYSQKRAGLYDGSRGTEG